MTFTVDIHHHLLPDFYRRATEHNGQSVGGVRPAVWTRANALSFMDDAGHTLLAPDRWGTAALLHSVVRPITPLLIHEEV
jgi:hypothetical protein